MHVWHRFAPRLPEANEAIERIATWLSEHWNAPMLHLASGGR